ncbi:hypothetical protein SS50377_26813 [Spironucleus salmonicida]|uniref:Uncharacterized protein n=1 Tax=Spironucleus salmonicida TaxID=348837 RepID=A0A9P8LM03_9EUKA|nr:hypothetical protein SS50377_26813 [Spironucleus salmonicida]
MQSDLPYLLKSLTPTTKSQKRQIIPPTYNVACQRRNIFIAHNGPLKIRITRYGDYDLVPYIQQKLCTQLIQPKQNKVMAALAKVLDQEQNQKTLNSPQGDIIKQ